MWTIACFPMGFIGYYIKKKNIISVIILAPLIALLSSLGVGYISAAINSFLHHLLSGICCFLFIIIISLNLFDKLLHRLLCILVSIITIFVMIFSGVWNKNQTYEVYKTIDLQEIPLVGEVNVSSFSGTTNGEVTVIHPDDDTYSLKISGQMGGEYQFTLTDANEVEYSFEYYFDKDENTVVLKQKKS